LTLTYPDKAYCHDGRNAEVDPYDKHTRLYHDDYADNMNDDDAFVENPEKLFPLCKQYRTPELIIVLPKHYRTPDLSYSGIIVLPIIRTPHVLCKILICRTLCHNNVLNAEKQSHICARIKKNKRLEKKGLSTSNPKIFKLIWLCEITVQLSVYGVAGL
jgi:hypothetical protein